MARVAYGVKLGQALPDGQYATIDVQTASDTTQIDLLAPEMTTLGINITSAKAAITAVEAAVAALEADGASPTQGHVTALRSAWNTESAACTALDPSPINTTLAAIAIALGTDAILNVNAAICTDGNAIRSCVRAIMKRVSGSGYT